MSYIERCVVPVTAAADGTATVYSPVLTGKIKTIRYVKNNYADTVDFTITAEATGEEIWSQSNVTASTTVAPRQATHSVAGAAALYAAAGTAVNDDICLSRDRIKIVLAQAGALTAGTFHFVLE